MKNKLTSLLASAAISLSLVSGANAQETESFGQCVTTLKVAFDGSIVDAAVATPELSTLVDLVVAADLVDALATTENLTVFAPTNDAFAALVSLRRETIQGQSVYLSRAQDKARVNNAGVACQGVLTDNGTVWIIDSVLLPAL
jgi:uncharacterized surface protein with fasciclin (FAS1) repeats